MDDPTKDTIPRSAVEYCLRKETVSTNPEKYKAHEKFIDYMDDPDISEFGHWMHSNGFNCALTAISVDLKKIPSVTPSAQQWIPCSERLPEEYGEYRITWTTSASKKRFVGDAEYEVTDEWDDKRNDFKGEWLLDDYIKAYPDVKVIAWKPIEEPYAEK